MVQNALDQTGLKARQVCHHLKASYLQTCQAMLCHHCKPACESNRTLLTGCISVCSNLQLAYEKRERMRPDDSCVLQIKVVIVASGAYK